LRLALIGDPVAHSVSPALHREFLTASGRSGTYEAIRVPAGEAARVLEELAVGGYRGVNVTTPLKEEAFARCERRDAAAGASGSVNTVLFEGGELRGHNTDGTGAVEALLTAGGLAGGVVLVLGAGPTARAAAYALRALGVRVVLWNRTRARAEAACGALDLEMWRPGMRPDAVFSALAPMSSPDDDELRRAIVAAPVVVDANYGPRATLAATLARPVIDGLTMLRASARASFELFASV
jgi:shikimate dehydrogenase